MSVLDIKEYLTGFYCFVWLVVIEAIHLNPLQQVLVVIKFFLNLLWFLEGKKWLLWAHPQAFFIVLNCLFGDLLSPARTGSLEMRNEMEF